MRFFIFFFGVTTFQVLSQSNGFEFGKITSAELDNAVFEQDTSAVAYVLDEFGEAYFDLSDIKYIHFEYHVKIKILKEAGRKYADFEIPLRKDGEIQESIQSIKAISYNRDGSTWAQRELNSKDIYSEKVNVNLTRVRFAVPDARVGSVIEVYYEFKTPYRYNFIPWRFQWDIPKVRSEFWGKYPAYYSYHITLKGYRPLSKNEFKVIKECTGSSSYGGGADCSFFKYAMENIPAFIEEPYMTARRNFEAAVTFELRQITYPDGQVDKVTNEWKDATQELKEHADFGFQIKRAKAHFKEMSSQWQKTIVNPMNRVQAIHDYFKSTFLWNGDLGFLTDKGVKRLFETNSGNVAELNLSLLAALQAANIWAEPVLLATRSKGLPIQFYPVLSDFNYVIVRIKIDDAFYFLDATSPLNTVGYLPERCLNGKGRALGETLDWIDLKPNDKWRVLKDFKLKLQADGSVAGHAVINHYGYAAFSIRNRYFDKNTTEEYRKIRTNEWPQLEVNNFIIEQTQDLTKPVVERFDWDFHPNSASLELIYLPLFLIDQSTQNPFRSNERLYPVDFGAPEEHIYLVNIEYPENFITEGVPQNVALVMPNEGGRLLLNVSALPGKLTLSCNLSLTKPIYSSDEYHALREIYTRYVALLQSMIVLKKG